MKKWLNSFQGTLMVLNYTGQTSSIKSKFKSRVLYLQNEPHTGKNQNPVKFQDLDEASQEKVRDMNVRFFGSKVKVRKTFLFRLDNMKFSSFVGFSWPEKSLATVRTIHGNQRIVNCRTVFNGAEEFLNDLLSKLRVAVLITGDAGMGKSTYLERIALVVQNKLPYFWRVEINLSMARIKLRRWKSKMKSVNDAVSFVEEFLSMDETQRLVFRAKVVAREAIFLMDAFDQLCPKRGLTAIKLMQLLSQTGVKTVIATRTLHQEVIERALNLANEAVYRICLLDEEEQLTIMKQYLKENNQYIIFMDKFIKRMHLFKHSIEVLGVPLHLMVVAADWRHFRPISTDLYKILIDRALSPSLSKGRKEKYSDIDAMNLRILHWKSAYNVLLLNGSCGDLSEELIATVNKFPLGSVSMEAILFQHHSFVDYLFAELVVKVPHQERGELSITEEQYLHILTSVRFGEVRRHMDQILSDRKISKYPAPFVAR